MSETPTSETPANETSRLDRDPAADRATARRHGMVAAGCVAFVALMVGAAYASVPLYQLFCRVTGFGGATQVASSAPAATSDREIEIRFDANVAPGLSWRFGPEQRTVTVKLGETKLIFYRVENTGSTPATATASYNVTPAQAGSHFAKMQCFCFTDQTLQPGEALDMPVVFFVDPALADDPDATGVNSITLSYTFFAKTNVAKTSVANPSAGTPEPAAGRPKAGEADKSPL